MTAKQQAFAIAQALEMRDSGFTMVGDWQVSAGDVGMAGNATANWALTQLYLREAVSREAGFFDGRVTGRDELVYWAPEALR
jgi:hypothetical protein